jgi:hypothetical protein
MHQLHLDGVLPDTQWIIVRKDIRGILDSAVVRTFWADGGSKAFDSAFSRFVSRVRVSIASNHSLQASVMTSKQSE